MWVWILTHGFPTIIYSSMLQNVNICWFLEGGTECPHLSLPFPTSSWKKSRVLSTLGIFLRRTCPGQHTSHQCVLKQNKFWECSTDNSTSSHNRVLFLSFIHPRLDHILSMPPLFGTPTRARISQCLKVFGCKVCT